MRRRIEQRLMLVLAVQLDQARGQILERAGGRERAVDERAAAALRGDLAPDEQFVAVRLSKIASTVGDLFAGPDEVAGGAAAEQQADGLDEDRLAGAGLAGQDVEARLELDLDRVDDREVA